MTDPTELPTGEPDDLATYLSRQVVEAVVPDELPFFDDVVQDYHRRQGAPPGSAARDEPLGFGLDIGLLAPYVVAIMPSIIHFLADAVREAFKTETETGIERLVRRLIRRTRAPSRPSEDIALTADQGRRLRSLSYARAQAVGLDDEHATLLADSIVGALMIAP